jgi:amino acid adenylation domain-containing protein
MMTPDNQDNQAQVWFPLSSAQSSRWFLYQLDPQCQGTHNNGFAVRARGQLDMAALNTALQTLVDRHPMLRTAFRQCMGKPQQATMPVAQVRVSCVDMSGATAQALQDRVQADCGQAFDLAHPPLVCAHLYRCGEGESVLLIVFDHLVCDGWSYWQLLEELGSLLSGRALADLEDDPQASYQAFVQWQQEWLKGDKSEAQWQYWHKNLAQDLPVLQLRTDHAWPQHKSYRRNTVGLNLSPELTAQLHILARKNAGTLFTTLLAAYHLLLRSLTGQDDIVIGTPMPGRSSKVLDRVVGDFVNPIAVRGSFDGQQTIAQVLRGVRGALLRGMSHQELPFSELVERLHPVRDMHDHPIFQTAFVFQKARHATDLLSLWAGDASGSPIVWGQLALTAFPMHQSGGNGHFPLVLEVLELGGGVRCEFTFDPDLFESATIARWVGYMQTVLSSMVDNDQQRIGGLSLLSARERQQILHDFNPGAGSSVGDHPQQQLIHQLFESQAAANPGATALVYGEQQISYDDVNRSANRLAHRLLALGIGPDDRVAICAERGPQMVIGLLGILKAGGAYVPLDPTYPAERLAHMLSDSAPVALLTEEALRDVLPAVEVPVLLLGQDALHVNDGNPDPKAQGLAASNLAYVIYTSGSTGLPKGVMNHHRGLCNLALAQQQLFGVGPGSRVLQFASFSFDASIWECVMALCSGASLHLAPQADLHPGEPLWQTLQQHQITHATLPGAVVALWGDAHLPQPITLIVAGDACPPAVARHWSVRHRMFNAYGPTETTVCASVFRCTPQLTGSVPIGRPITNAQMYILDQHGQLAPIGVAGEIHVGGAGVARGYLNQAGLTAERFIDDSFSDVAGARLYKTGDLGRWLPDGDIEYLGRNDFQVKMRGFRVELGEIEARLAECAGVLEAVVIAREDVPGDKRLVAYLVTENGVEIVPAALRAQLSAVMPAYMAPSAFVCMGAFPLTPNGKPDRKALPAPDYAAVATHEYEAPMGDVEIAIAQVWQDLLGLQRVGRRDHFFELGGHSLMVVAMTEALRTYGLMVDVRMAFNAPVLSDLAAAMRDGAVASSLLPVPANVIVAGCVAITPGLLPLIDLTQAEIDLVVANVPGGAGNVQDIYPLAPPQEGILFHHLLETEGDAYLLRSSFALDGRERLDAYLGALQAVLDRHDVLRTGVFWEGLPQPLQVVHRAAKLPVRELTLSKDGDAAAQFLALTDPRQIRLNLGQAPLMVTFIAADPHSGEWFLAMLIHHLACDHISLDIMVAELQAFLQGDGGTLPPALPYRDFVVRARTVPVAEHEQYFRRQLGDLTEPTTPFGLLNVQADGGQVDEARHILGGELTRRIHRCASLHRVTAGVLFHVAWAQVMAQCSGRDDVVFGTVLSGRMQGADGMGNVVGMFVNTLPVRVGLAQRSVLQVVRETWQSLNGLLDHEQASLALAQRCSGVASGSPLFTALLNYRHSDASALTGSTVRVGEGMRFLAVEERTNYPFTLNVDDVAQDFVLTAQCVGGIDPARLALYTATAMAQLVDALSAAPDQLLRHVDLAIAVPPVVAVPRVDDHVALSAHQGRMWFVDTFEAGNLYEASPVYHNVPLLLELDRAVPAEVIGAALNTIIARHEVLRSRVGKIGEAVVLMIAPVLAIALERVRCDAAEVRETAILATRKPLDFIAGQLIRAVLVEADGQPPLLAVTAHHLLADRVSMRLIGRELLELCAARLESRAANLPDLPLQYADCAAWQGEFLREQSAALLFYWRYQLRGRLQAMELPLNRPRPLVHTFTEARHAFALSPALTAGLKAAAKRADNQRGVSHFSMLFTGFNALLRRYAGHDELVVGASVACRNQVGLDNVVGPIANLLVLRNFCDGSTTLADLLAQVQRTTQEALHYQEMQFDQLVLALKPEKDMSRTALFDILFQFDEDAPQVLRASGLSARIVETNLGFGKNDLHLYMHGEGEGEGGQWAGKLVYNADFFDAWIVEQMMRHYVVLLEAMVADANAPIDTLPLLGQDEERQQLIEWNTTDARYPADKTVHQLIEEQVERSPNRIAVNCGEVRLSYRQLNQRANQLAHHLRQQGVVEGSFVALCLERSVDMLVAMLGVMKAGGAYVPIDPAYPAERIAYVLGDCAANCVVTGSACVAAGLFPADLPAVLMDLPAVFADAAITNPMHAGTPDNLIYVIYTSGSTGMPKGTMLEHRNVVRLLVNDKLPFSFGENDVWTMFHSYAFDFSVWEIYGALLYGGRVVMVPDLVRRDPAALVDLLIGEQVSVLNQTPTAFYNLIAEIGKQPGLQLPALRYVVFGGEGLDPINLQAFAQGYPQVALINMYGITETCVHVTFKRITDADITGNSRNIGRPIPTTSVLLMGPNRQLLPVGVVGEIYVGGLGLGRGYLNRDELTAERFISHPWQPGQRLYRSGDLGKLFENGEMAHLGRIDDQVQLRGFRIELGEIEVRLAACAGVREAVVIVREDAPGDKRLAAYLIAEDGVTLSIADLRHQLTQVLTEYMVPSAFVTLQRFPLTANGKLDRKALPAPDRFAVVTRQYEAPMGEIEATIAKIWQELLGVDQVGRNAQFFELGGHSLTVVTLIERLRQHGLILDVKSVFTAPTLSAMAAAVAQAGDVAATPAFAVPPNLIPPDCDAITPGMLPLVTLDQDEIDRIVANVEQGAANIADIYPLTPLQDGILFHHMLDAQGDPYLLRSMLSFDNRSRMEAFVAALQAVIDRHDILRSGVQWEGLLQAVQVVQRKAVLQVHEIAPKHGSSVMEQLKQCSDPRHLRIDLGRAPLLVAYVAVDPDSGECLMALLNHHLVCDHVTLELIIAEIRLFLLGQGAQLPVSLPYRNFVAQTRIEPMAVHEAWFRQQLGDIEEPTAPFGLQDVHGDGDKISEAYLALDADLAQSIRDAARQHGVTAAVLFHVAVAQVLGKCSGRDDVVFGTVLSGRLQGSEGADRVLGMFINTLPVRVSLAGRSVGQVVAETYTRLSQLLSHEQASLALAQRCSGVSAPLPLFTALLNYRHGNALEGDGKASVFGVEGMRLLGAEERTNYPITLSIDDLGQGFAIHAQCSGAAEPERLAAYVHIAIGQLVAALNAQPMQPMESIDILPLDERRRLLIDFNAGNDDYPRDKLIHELFEAQAADNPDATALLCQDGRSMTYDALNRRANRLAHHLIGLGIGPDERVAICVERSFDLVVGLLGILKAGAAYVPLDPSFPAERLTYMLDDTASRLLITESGQLTSLPVQGRQVLCLDSDAQLLERQPESNPGRRAQADNLAYCMYTSGSSGQPKGVLVEHRNVVHLVINNPFAVIISADCLAHCANPAFDASTWEVWGALLNGARVLLIPQNVVLQPQEFCRALQDGKVTAMWLTVALLNQYADALAPVLSNLNYLLFGGEQSDLGVIKRIVRQSPPRHLINGYGPTETTTFAATYDVMALEADAQRVPIGRAINHATVYVLDRRLQPVALGVTGEIYIGGAGVARGYLNRPELSAVSFVDDPFCAGTVPGRMYKTGDLGRWLTDGNIEYMGRNDSQVKIRGFRIELGEIEAHLLACTGVREALVVVREDQPGNKRLVAYLLVGNRLAADGLAADAPQLGAAALREQLAGVLPAYMAPSAFVILDAYPLTPNGKVDRKALPMPDQAALAMSEYAAPVGQVEVAIAQIWQELLGVGQVGREDQFFELGGHSLLVVTLMERLRKQGLSLDVRSIFNAPTLRAMAAAVALQSDTPAFVVPPNLIADGCTAITPDMLALVDFNQAEIDSIVATVPGGAANVQDIYPLAPLQEGILFHHLLESGRDAYLLRSVFTFDSRQRLDGYLSAMQVVIDRHDILRSAVCWEGLSQSVQVVYRNAPLPVRTLVLSADGDALAQLMARTETSELRLDLRRAPLFACYIAADPHSGAWLLTLLSHHMVCDHVTLELMVGEIGLLLDGQAANLPPILPYRNFIAHTRSIPASEHEAYFREQLGDIDEPTAPYGLLDTQGDGGAVDEVKQPLPDSLSQRIRAVARLHGINAAVLFHVAVAQVLGHCSGREDVVFGSVLLGRLQGSEGADQVLGMFINTLPLRISLSGRSVVQVVKETYRRMTDLLAHEQAPLALAQRCSGVRPPLPLFSALLNYRHSEVADAGADEGKISVLEGMRVLRTEDLTNYPFTMRVDDFGQGFAITAQCNQGINSTRIVSYLETAVLGLVDALEQAPQTLITALSVLPNAERQQILTGFNRTAVDYPQQQLIHHWFEQQAADTPDAVAVVYQDQSLCYGALNRRANQLAHHLLGLGIGPDDRVAICIERGVEMAVGLLGILKAGGGYVPLDPSYPADRLAYMLEDCAPAALVSQSEQLDMLPWIAAPIVALDEEAAALARKPDTNPVLSGLLPQHLAYVIYTSGSTGLPKGVMVEHRSLLASTQARADFYAKQQRFLLLSSIGFDSSIAGIFGTLVTAGTLHISGAQAAQDPQLLARYICENGITSLLCVPSLARLILDNLNPADGANLQSMIVAGEACPQSLRAQVAAFSPQLALYNEYGPTEATVWASGYLCGAGDHGPVPIGRPIANARIYILDAHGQAVGLGVSGEIHIGGAGVARGYLFRPELTDERFIADPFGGEPNARLYKTGDLGRWRPDGNVEYLGRNDFQVKIRGFRIELGEIEARLSEHGAVREAVVLAREDGTGDKRLVAYLLVDDGGEIAINILRDQLAAVMPAYMVPSAFVVMHAFPLTPNGKLDRKALPAPDQDAVLAREYEAPLGETEIAIAQIWQELLGLERVGRHDHFFELGGHSLMVVSMIERLRPHGFSADVRMVFNAPTLAQLASSLSDVGSTVPAFVVPPNLIAADSTAITPDMLPLIKLSQPEIDKIVAGVPLGAANIQDIYPLAPLQEGILFQHLLEAEGDSYIMRAVIEFDGRSRLDAFLSAMQMVIDRHDILRSAASWEGLSQPVQVVYRHAVLPVEELTLDRDGDAMQQLLRRIDPRHMRLDLRCAPLMAAYVAADTDTDSDKWFLVLLDHHLICDHVTLEFILAEIQVLLQGRSASLPKALPYRNFIALTHAVSPDEHEAYFRRQLGDVEEPTAPFGLFDPSHDDTRLEVFQQHLDLQLAGRMREAARQHKVTLAVLFHVAWAQVLASHCGRDDVVFGTVLSGRLQGSDGADQVLGMFINTLPIRIVLTDRSVEQVVAETYQRLTGLLTHEQASLPLVQRCSGLPAATPLLNVLLNYRHSQLVFTPDGDVASLLEWDGMRVLSAEERATHPCTLTVDDMAQGFALTVQCYAEFDPARVFAHLQTAIAALVDALSGHPTQPFMELNCLPQAERSKLLFDFNSARADYPRNRLIHQLFEERVAVDPLAPALLVDGVEMGYGDLNRRANQLAHHLIGMGVRPDDRVAVCMERSVAMVVALLGVLKAGGAYVPLDPGYPVARFSYMLQDSAPVALLIQPTLLDRFPTSEVPLIAFDCALDGAVSPFAGLPEHNPDPVALNLYASNLAYVIYTSGSTGMPKGVMNQHDGVVNRLLWAQSVYGLDGSDRVLQKTPFSFDVSVWEFFLPLLTGAQLVLARPEGHQDPQYLSSLIAEAAITTLHFVPSMLQAFLEQGDAAAGGSLRRVLCSGEALPYALQLRFAQRYPAVELHNLYGPTEAAIDVTSWLCEPDRYAGIVPIGRPIANIQIYILDGHLRLVPLGVAGEIHIGGIGVARGYLNRPELTNERFIACPFGANADARLYKTGDLGRWLPDGNIEYLGRNDFQVKIRGFRIELGEIEARLLESGSVREAVVIAREGQAGDKRLVAYLVAHDGMEISTASLREHLLGVLPGYMTPSAFVVLPVFPLTPNGKLDRKALPAPDQGAVVTREYAAPIGEMEIAIAQIWHELLGLERIGRDDHFFELGGHSLLAMRLLVRVREVLYVDVPLAKVFQTPTIASLAELVFAEQMGQFQSEDIDRLAEGIDDLSEEELRALLAQDD